MDRFGISLYLGSGPRKNVGIIAKARDAGIHCAFTSLQIPEESSENSVRDVKELLNLCKESGISLIADIGPRTMGRLGFRDFSDLKRTCITHLRVDYGFSCREMVKLSKDFHLVVNASTLREEEVRELKSLNADFSRISACHNFYPKPLTGLSVERVRRINERMHRFGLTTIAFTAGDGELRGPLKMGLPTVEEHRNGEVLLNMLQLRELCGTDVCMVGDVDCSNRAYRQIKELSEGYVTLDAEIRPEYRYVAGLIHHDRPDSSEYVIRSQESRGYASQGKLFPAENMEPRKRGSISVGNEKYLRYSGELEIARQDLPTEKRVNIIGRVKPESLPYLDYITDGMGFRFQVGDEPA